MKATKLTPKSVDQHLPPSPSTRGENCIFKSKEEDRQRGGDIDASPPKSQNQRSLCGPRSREEGFAAGLWAR